MTSRRGARRAALFVLFQWDLTGQPLASLYEIELDPYTRSLAEDVTERAAELDRRITASARGWTAERLGAVERNVLRIALVELDRGDVPLEVAIDEAVRLAKRYASEEAARLVNGILGNVARRGPLAAGERCRWRVPSWLHEEGHPELEGVEEVDVEVAEAGEGDPVLVEDLRTRKRYEARREELRR